MIDEVVVKRKKYDGWYLGRLDADTKSLIATRALRQSGVKAVVVMGQSHLHPGLKFVRLRRRETVLA